MVPLIVIRNLPRNTTRVPTAFVTGATGFYGLNLIKRLREDGWNVTALHLPSADLTFLSKFDADCVTGDVTDADSVLRSMPANVDAVFHLAASVNFWRRNNDDQTRVNVDGTRNVVDAALSLGAKRFVQASSMWAFAPGDGTVLREDTPSQASSHWINYFRTKWLADEQVRNGVEQGLHASFVAPGFTVGPYELSNMSQLFTLLKAGKLPGAFPGSGPWCHVDSVVDAMIRASEVASPGDMYLIGSVHASFAEVAAKAASRLDVKAPRPLPAWLLKSLAGLMDLGSRVTGKEPDITPELAHMFSLNFSLDCAKAKRELDYKEKSLDVMLDDMYAWLLAENRI